ncbi:MAG: hypothetical protein KJO11_05405 [Gemmatimonadetes bacterium]|nr:hypothetical protein [Gemmatimonadota bacterium]
MRLVSLHAPAAPGLGTLEADYLPAGFVAVLAPDSRVRRALHAALSGEAGPDASIVTSPRGPDPSLARLPDGLADRLRTGRGLADLDAVVEAGTRALAWLDGLDRIEAARGRLARLSGANRDGAPPPALVARMHELESAPAECARLEEALRRHREDDVEVAGDLEQATMEWLRERQDAETRLQAYRDRARELKARLRQMEEAAEATPCPTCGRPLADHFDTVLETFRDEWEGVVQDGSWWRRRREQLEGKPQSLQELESRALQLHAAALELAERVHAARALVDELDELRARVGPEPATGTTAPGESVARTVDDALAEAGREVVAAARHRLLDRAAAYLLRLSAGRLLGFRLTSSGRTALVGPEVDLSTPPDEDGAAARLAVRLAAVECIHEAVGSRHAALVVGDPFDRLEESVKVRAADLLSERSRRNLVQVLLVTRGEVVDLVPEAFDGVLEYRRDATGGGLRPVPAGSGVIRLRA